MYQFLQCLTPVSELFRNLASGVSSHQGTDPRLALQCLSRGFYVPENLNVRSQDLPTIYHDAGQFYWGTAHSFQTKQPVFSAHSKIVRLPRKRVQDIDTLEDWEIAEALFKVIG